MNQVAAWTTKTQLSFNKEWKHIIAFSKAETISQIHKLMITRAIANQFHQQLDKITLMSINQELNNNQRAPYRSHLLFK